MIHKCYLLFKVQLLGSFGINKLKYSSDKNEKRSAILLGIAMILVGIVIALYSIGIAIGAKEMGMVSILPPLMLMISSLIVFIFTFIKSNGVLFGFRDYDMVMSLPVSTGTVIISRLVAVYIMNFLITIAAMLPSIIVYGTTLGVSFLTWIMLITSIFIAPFIPMIFAVIIGAIITWVSVRFKYKNILSIVFSIGVIIAIMPASFNVNISSNADVMNILNTASNMINNMYPMAKLYGDSLTSGSPLSYVLFVLISLGGMVVFIALLSTFYTKINNAIFSKKSNSNYKIGRLKSSTKFKSLYIKEVRRLFSCSIYLLNSSICIILLAVGSIALLFMNIEESVNQAGLLDLFVSMKKLAPLMVSAVVTMSCTTSVAMSIEGKNRWIICSSPATAKEVFNAKIATNLTVLLPCILVISSMLSLSLKTNLVETLMLFVVPIVYGFFTGVVGLLCNLKFPKYDWTSEYQAVKQSFSVILSMIVGLVATVIPLGIGFVLQNYITVVMIVTVIVILIITFLLYRKLSRVKLFL